MTSGSTGACLRQSGSHYSPLEGESQKPSRSPELVEGQATADAVGGPSVATALKPCKTPNPPQSPPPSLPSLPCLRRGLFLARPRKRPKKKGACLRGAPRCRQAAQAPRGLLFRELSLGRKRKLLPCGPLRCSWRWRWTEPRGKAPSLHRIPFLPTILPELSPLPSKNPGTRASRRNEGTLPARQHRAAGRSCPRQQAGKGQLPLRQSKFRPHPPSRRGGSRTAPTSVGCVRSWRSQALCFILCTVAAYSGPFFQDVRSSGGLEYVSRREAIPGFFPARADGGNVMQNHLRPDCAGFPAARPRSLR